MTAALCVCGHGHFKGGGCWCGCSEFQPDDGTDGPASGIPMKASSMPSKALQKLLAVHR